MEPPNNDIYVLPRDTQETQRLNEQHKYLLRCFPFHIHPAISISQETTDLRIADIACGSGIWLTEVAQQYPKAECHGFDISGEQFPEDKAFGQGSVRFHVEDAASEAGPAPEFLGKFDVVAVRLIHISLIGEAWNRVVRNLLTMLKPGGHIQWIDWDPQTAYLINYKPLAKLTAMQELLSGWKQFLQTRDTGVAARLGNLLAANGFEDVLEEKYCSDPDMETREFIMGTLLGAVPGVLRKVLVGSGWTEERVVGLERRVEEERRAGEAFLRFDMGCWVARKPG